MAARLRHRGAWVAVTASISQAALAQSVVYTDVSTHEKLQSSFGVGLDEDWLSLQADMTLVGQDGRTRVLPRVTTAWSGLEFLEIDTALQYEDWNSSAEPLRPTIDTRVMLSAGVPFVSAIEGSLRRSGASSTDTWKVKFAGLDTGVDVLGGDPFRLDADVVMRAGGDGAGTTSNVTSSWGLGRAVDVKTGLRFDYDGTGERAAPALDTSFVYQPSVAFIDRLEGELHRSTSGDLRQSIGLRFSELSRGDPYGSSLKISSRAIVEEMLHADGPESVSMGFETKLTGMLPPLLGGSNALSLRVDRQLDDGDGRSSTLVYDHTWSPGDTSIGLNLKVLRRLDAVEPSMGVTWTTQF